MYKYTQIAIVVVGVTKPIFSILFFFRIFPNDNKHMLPIECYVRIRPATPVKYEPGSN